MAVSTGAALLGSAGLGFLGSMNSSRQAGRAADAQVQASREANELQRYMYDQNRADMMPFLNNSINATNTYNALLGLPLIGSGQPQMQRGMQGGNFNGNRYNPNPLPNTPGIPNAPGNGGLFGRLMNDLQYESRDTRVPRYQMDNQYTPTAINGRNSQNWDFSQGVANGGGAQPQQSVEDLQNQAINAFRNLPGYQENLYQQLQAVDRGAAARGGALSGRALMESQRTASNYADNSFNNYLNRIGASAGQAVPITQQLGAQGMQSAQIQGNNLQNAGQARASGYMNQANAWNQFGGGLSGMLGYFGGRR